MNKYVKLILKIAVSTAIFVFIYKTENLGAFKESLIDFNFWYAPLILGLLILNYVVSSFRWKSLLIYDNTQHITIPYLTKLYFIGSFFNNFMPTSIGGDVYKIYTLGKKIDNATHAFSATFMERFTGILVLAFISVCALVLQSNLIGLGLLVLFIFGTIVGLYSLKFLATKISSLDKLYQSLILYKGQTKVVVWALVTSLIVQLIAIFTQYFIFLGLGHAIPILDALLILPIITIASFFIPSLNGLGVQDGLYIKFFEFTGVALAASILYHLARLLISLIGGVLYAFQKD